MNENVDMQQVDSPRPAELGAPAPAPAEEGCCWSWILVALAVIAVVLLAWRYFEGGAPASNPQAATGTPPQTRARRAGDDRRHADHHRRTRDGDAACDRHRRRARSLVG